ncbi:MAG: methyltransferase [Elusimicrobia bacterium]|nr:methyltransferase [Elusimicrobiota bacterium]
MNSTKTSGREILEMVRAFQPACVLIAGADLDVFTILHRKPMTAAALAARIKGQARPTEVMLDALAALGMLKKSPRGVYSLPRGLEKVLTEDAAHGVLGMLRHQGTCLRRWGDLAAVVKTGRPAEKRHSVRGPEGDLESFIRAMHEVSTPLAGPLVASLGKLKFARLLDLGGASGTWTIPFLKACPGARATIFDLPQVIPMARRRMGKLGLGGRIDFAAGDYNRDAMPAGHDLAWVSAIVHQNSRAQNREMFRKVYEALVPGGRILIRDVVVDSTRTRPVHGALFAVNMLVGTQGGSTFTFGELKEDLESAGFTGAKYLRRGQAMDTVVAATKPRAGR